jgi:hypothetical protein
MENKTLEKMEFLVYWYGETTDSKTPFAIKPQNEFMDWSTGVRRHLHELRQAIQTKISKQKKLSRVEEIRVRAQAEVDHDLKLLPADRERKFFPFQEC